MALITLPIQLSILFKVALFCLLPCRVLCQNDRGISAPDAQLVSRRIEEVNGGETTVTDTTFK